MKSINYIYIRDKIYYLKSYQIFITSFLICVLFYYLEFLLGIDRFYHPDSLHYLQIHSKPVYLSLHQILNDPFMIFHRGYYYVTHLLSNNYPTLILLNFILYSFTNILIYKKIFKKFINKLDYLKLFFLFYILFLDPYRLHLASHTLKETFLIFFMITLIISNIKIVKILSIIMLEFFRKNALIYVLIFLTYSNIKKIILNIKKKNYVKIFYTISALSIIFIISLFLFLFFNQSLYDVMQSGLSDILEKIRYFDTREMPLRSYDKVNQFKSYDFPISFLLKNITWPIMLVSGFFMFFVSSFLFKFLGIIIFLNNILIYMITKKTFINIGLIIILLMISIYSSSYTAMFRYSYIALYSSIIYFFLNFNLDGYKHRNI